MPKFIIVILYKKLLLLLLLLLYYYAQSFFEKTYATKQKNVKSHVFLEFEKNT